MNERAEKAKQRAQRARELLAQALKEQAEQQESGSSR